MTAMTCDKFQAFLPDMILNSTHVSADVRQHLVECSICRKDWKELQTTMQLLDEWGAPEPSPYFDTRMTARLREEKNSRAPGWLERLRARLLFDENLRLRPAMAVGFALLLIIGAGSYEGLVSLNRTQRPRQTVSATVNDLELLDSNAQTLQELAAFDNTDATAGRGTSNNSSN
jgi:hypothetical protein